MAFDPNTIISGIQNKPPRILLWGAPKTGKSTFASKFPSPFLLPIKREEGVDAIDCPKLPKSIESTQELRDVLLWLIQTDHNFKTVIIDSISTLEPLIFEEVCRENGVDTINKVGGGFGNGYTESTKKFNDLINLLNALREKGIIVILIGHVKSNLYNNLYCEDYYKYIGNVVERHLQVVEQWADCIFFSNFDVVVNNDSNKASVGRSWLYTKPSPVHSAGCRKPWNEQLPEKLPLEFEKFNEFVKLEF